MDFWFPSSVNHNHQQLNQKRLDMLHFMCNEYRWKLVFEFNYRNKWTTDSVGPLPLYVECYSLIIVDWRNPKTWSHLHLVIEQYTNSHFYDLANCQHLLIVYFLPLSCEKYKINNLTLSKRATCKDFYYAVSVTAQDANHLFHGWNKCLTKCVQSTGMNTRLIISHAIWAALFFFFTIGLFT